MSDLKFYFHGFSQPSRAVMTLLEIGNIPYQLCCIDWIKVAGNMLPNVWPALGGSLGENRTNKEFMDVSPTRKVPAIDDNGFKLIESSAILKYLVVKYKLPDHWYPSNPERQAKVEEYLNWHGTGMRHGAVNFFYNTFFYQQRTGNPPDEKVIKEGKEKLQKGLEILESHFLKDTKFINSSEISIADIQAACELSQFWMTDVDFLEDKPKLKQWLDNVHTELNPSFDVAHKMVNDAGDQGIFKNKK